jgi:hypothetical protein
VRKSAGVALSFRARNRRHFRRGLRYHDRVARTVDSGLCRLCIWSRQVSAAVSTFTMCTRGLTDPAYPKYPVLPVAACRGYERAEAAAGDRGEAP